MGESLEGFVDGAKLRRVRRLWMDIFQPDHAGPQTQVRMPPAMRLSVTKPRQCESSVNPSMSSMQIPAKPRNIVTISGIYFDGRQ